MDTNGGATRLRHYRTPPSSERFIGKFDPPNPRSPSPQVELSEQDIFSSPSGSTSSLSPTHLHYLHPKPSSRNGILAALKDTRSKPGSVTRPVFNHKASFTSTPPAISIPRRLNPPVLDRPVLSRQSAPISVPVMSAAMRHRARGLDDDVDVVVEEEEGEGDGGVVLMPPHEVVAARESPLFSHSVLEGVGRTLKGRDLRQVRNAIWRRTGFID